MLLVESGVVEPIQRGVNVCFVMEVQQVTRRSFLLLVDEMSRQLFGW